MGEYVFTKIEDDKKTNEAIIDFINQLENSLKGAYSIAKQLEKQIPEQQPTTNEEKSLYNGNYIKFLKTISDNCEFSIKKVEEFKKELSNAHIVEEDIIEEFPLKARNALRESENKEQTYKELLEDLDNRFNSLKDKDKYKDQVEKIKKDLDAFYKETFKK